MSGEFLRKAIHLGSLSIPIVYAYTDKTTALSILIPLTIFSIGIDVGRHYLPGLRKIVNRIFDRILRAHEKDEKLKLLSGATYVLLSATLCVLMFPKLITITAFSILIVSDASSALYGRAFGKHKFFDKSLEGTMAFVVSAWFVVLVTPKAGPQWEEYVIAAIAAVIGGVFEAASVRLRTDDNLSVPASIAVTMWALYYGLSQLDPMQYQGLYEKLMQFV
jgi:dolichol kinase